MPCAEALFLVQHLSSEGLQTTGVRLSVAHVPVLNP